MTTAGGSQAKYFLRTAPFDLLRREEAGKVVADNLIGSVTFDSFGTGIPTENLTLRVHHEDGVVMDSIEEQSVSFFALAKGVLREPTAFLHLRQMCFCQFLKLSPAAGQSFFRGFLGPLPLSDFADARGNQDFFGAYAQWERRSLRSVIGVCPQMAHGNAVALFIGVDK